MLSFIDFITLMKSRFILYLERLLTEMKADDSFAIYKLVVKSSTELLRVCFDPADI